MNKYQEIEKIITNSNTGFTTDKKINLILNLFKKKKTVKKTVKTNNISILKTLITKNSIMPILNTIYIDKTGYAHSTNLEQRISVKIDKPEGVYEIVGKELIKSSFNSEEFPVSPKIKSDKKIIIQLNQDIIQNLINCSCRDENKLCLSGVNLQSKNKHLYICSTTGKRLFYSQLDSYEKDINIIIPIKVFEILQKIKQYEIDLTINIDNTNKILLQNKDFSIISMLIDGQYPNYWDVIPKTAKQCYLFDKEELLFALNELKPYTDKDRKTVSIFENKIEIKYPNINRIKSINLKIKKEILPATFKIDNYNGFIIMPVRNDEEKNKIISLNFDYLYDSIKNNDDGTISMFYENPNRAITIQSS